MLLAVLLPMVGSIWTFELCRAFGTSFLAGLGW
jgi:hypothetical protein